jgi:hypothetical protein
MLIRGEARIYHHRGQVEVQNYGFLWQNFSSGSFVARSKEPRQTDLKKMAPCKESGEAGAKKKLFLVTSPHKHNTNYYKTTH